MSESYKRKHSLLDTYPRRISLLPKQTSMKKQLLLLTALFTMTVTHGQFNPVKNLKLTHVYQNPRNCYELSWSPPNPSTDTLIGYNIYRNKTFYVFTTNTAISYNPCQGISDTTYGGFMLFNYGAFYAHVTAVYNKSHIESSYNDSAHWGGLYNGIKENWDYDRVQIFPNPLSTQATLQTANPLKNASLTVCNSVGQIVKRIDNLVGQTIVFHRDNLPSGLYFVRLTQDGSTISVDKFVITDR